MLAFILILAAVGLLLVLFRYLGAKNQPDKVETALTDADGECCGAHAVCEKDSLLNKNIEIIYYDDEELDVLANQSPETFTVEEQKQLEDVFYTLKESDVAGWLKSLQLRNISLPENLREEALLIIRERRFA